MDGSFVEAIAAQVAEPRVLTVGEKDVLVAPSDWRELEPKLPELASPLSCSTLYGIEDYIEGNRDKLKPEELVLLVGVGKVQLMGALDEDARRACYMVATAPEALAMFGRWVTMESLVIALQTQFVKDAARDAFLTFVSSVTVEGVRTSDDDGYSQEVTQRQGVKLTRDKVPSPVQLRPYRTFREVEQPASAFMVRVRAGSETPEFLLSEADGGAWRIEAVAAVAAWLNERVGVVKVIR